MRPAILTLAFAALAAMATPAWAAWDIYSYPEAKFAAQFPAQPQVAAGTYRTTAGLDVPAQHYRAQEGKVAYILTIADFSGTAVDKEAALADAVKAFGQQGEVTVDVEARINSEYGRELSVERRDGGRDIVAAFFFDQHLYLLNGRASPPDPKADSANLIRFQQSLNFMR
jgi:hypothetical protein